MIAVSFVDKIILIVAHEKASVNQKKKSVGSVREQHGPTDFYLREKTISFHGTPYQAR
jgi:hypothetical protein